MQLETIHLIENNPLNQKFCLLYLEITHSITDIQPLLTNN